jgi:hypothetical protein
MAHSCAPGASLRKLITLCHGPECHPQLRRLAVPSRST